MQLVVSDYVGHDYPLEEVKMSPYITPYIPMFSECKVAHLHNHYNAYYVITKNIPHKGHYANELMRSFAY